MYLMELPTDENLESLAQRYPHMDVRAFKACVTLVRSGIDLLIAFENFLERFKLSQGRFLVLTIMNREPEQAFTPTQLAEKLNVSRATMTGLLDGLEAAGLVERSIHTQDRRKMRVRMTPQGERTMDEILPEYYRSIAMVMGGLSEEEQHELVEMMHKVGMGLKDLHSGAADA